MFVYYLRNAAVTSMSNHLSNNANNPVNPRKSWQSTCWSIIRQ